MNIEGTPHERALLVTFAYIIGFITAAIAFNYALGGAPAQVAMVAVSPATQPASVATAVPTTEPEAAAPAATPTVSDTLVYENQGLYLYTDADFPVLLSKHIDALDISYDDLPELADRQGFHTAVPGYEYFAAYEFVYYCEQYDANTCVPYLYDVAEAQLRVVQDATGPVSLPIAAANQATLTLEAGLTIPGYRSASPAEPHRVVAQ